MAMNQKVIDRINEILRQVSEENMGGRSNRYIGSGLSQEVDRARRKKSSEWKSDIYNQMGGNLNEGSYIIHDPHTGNNYFETVGEGGNMVAGAGRVGFPTGGARRNALTKPKKKIVIDEDFEVQQSEIPFNQIPAFQTKSRKKRKDTGKPRNTEWTQFVKEVSASYGIPYNKALSVASQLKKQGYTLDDL